MCWSSLAASLGEQLRARGGSGYLSVVSSRVACDALLCKRVCMNSAAELVLLGKAAEMLQLCCAAFYLESGCGWVLCCAVNCNTLEAPNTKIVPSSS